MVLLTVCLSVCIFSFIVGGYFAGRLERGDDRLELLDHIPRQPHRGVVVVLRLAR